MKKGISQEGLKLIACLTMLIDHIGYAIVYPMYLRSQIAGGLEITENAQFLHTIYLVMKSIGRLSFPIFCFLLVEGVRHTRSRKKYGLRLLFAALLSELPFNLVVSGSPVWRYRQSVMLTLLLGLIMLIALEKCKSLSWKPVIVLPFAVAAELLHVDYGWSGLALIALFSLSSQMYNRNLIRFCGMLVLFHYMSSTPLSFGSVSIPLQALGALSMLFIAAYDGRKVTNSKFAQWAFYLFYPGHLLLLWGVSILLPQGFSL